MEIRGDFLGLPNKYPDDLGIALYVGDSNWYCSPCYWSVVEKMP